MGEAGSQHNGQPKEDQRHKQGSVRGKDGEIIVRTGTEYIQRLTPKARLQRTS